MDTKKIKEGVSVKEIEGFAKKHRFEVFFCLAFVLSLIFSMVFFEGWSLPFAVIGGILGLVWSAKTEGFVQKMFSFCLKQEDMTQMIIGGAILVLSVFLPFVFYFLLGLCGGGCFKKLTTPAAGEHKE